MHNGILKIRNGGVYRVPDLCGVVVDIVEFWTILRGQ